LRATIYKSIFGDYDDIPSEPPPGLADHFRFILITGKSVQVHGWENVVKEYDDPVLANRECKFAPWNYFSCDHSFYLDGHVSVGENFLEFSKELINSDYVFSALKHRAGGSIADELFRCLNNGKINNEGFLRFLSLGVDFKKVAIECGFIYRKHNCKQLREQGNNWMDLFRNIAPRDQLLVHESFERTGLTLNIIEASFNSQEDFLRVGIHRNGRIKSLKSRVRKAYNIMRTGLLFDDK
jgi:hypothetical protein